MPEIEISCLGKTSVSDPDADLTPEHVGVAVTLAFQGPHVLFAGHHGVCGNEGTVGDLEE